MSTLKLIYNSRCIELFLVVNNILFSKLTLSVFILWRFKAFECYVMTCNTNSVGKRLVQTARCPLFPVVSRSRVVVLGRRCVACPGLVPGRAAPTVCGPEARRRAQPPADQTAAVTGAVRVLLWVDLTQMETDLCALIQGCLLESP